MTLAPPCRPRLRLAAWRRPLAASLAGALSAALRVAASRSFVAPLVLLAATAILHADRAHAQGVTGVGVEAAESERAGDDFIRVEGAGFVLRGAPWHFLGANVAVMHGQAHRAAMERVLDAVRDDGLTVVRVWALGERASDAPPWARDYAFRIGEEAWVESSFAHLDRLLVAARARGLRVILVLANRWSDYGGFPRYLRWGGAREENLEAGELTELQSAAFYDCSRCDALYRAHVARVVGRVNTLSGVAYRDDPTILAWELANELSAHPRDRASLVRWVTESARFLRSLDARQLISAGHIGYARASDRQSWLAVQRIAEIDYADAHAYPLRSGRVRTLAELSRFVDDRVQLAHHVAKKPFVWGEYGFSTRERTLLGLARTAWFDAFLSRSHHDGVDGALVWHYVPHDARPAEHALYPDGPGAASTRDVRRVLARHARRWRSTPPVERNARLSDARGEQPLMPLDQELRGSRAPHAAWEPAIAGSRLLAIAPHAFAYARFEALGVWREPPVAHVWGAGAGELRYRFRAPSGQRVPSLFVVRFRASSELPGTGAGARATDISRVEVLIGDVPLGTLIAPVDDGQGAWLELVVDDAALLARAFGTRARVYELRLRVDAAEGAGGLCVYAEDFAHPEAPSGRVELRWR